MTIGINCGHTVSGAGSGAVGIIKESEHTRCVGQALMHMLRSAGVTVVDCTIWLKSSWKRGKRRVCVEMGHSVNH